MTGRKRLPVDFVGDPNQDAAAEIVLQVYLATWQPVFISQIDELVNSISK